MYVCILNADTDFFLYNIDIKRKHKSFFFEILKVVKIKLYKFYVFQFTS